MEHTRAVERWRESATWQVLAGLAILGAILAVAWAVTRINDRPPAGVANFTVVGKNIERDGGVRTYVIEYEWSGERSTVALSGVAGEECYNAARLGEIMPSSVSYFRIPPLGGAPQPGTASCR